ATNLNESVIEFFGEFLVGGDAESNCGRQGAKLVANPFFLFTSLPPVFYRAQLSRDSRLRPAAARGPLCTWPRKRQHPHQGSYCERLYPCSPPGWGWRSDNAS